MLIERYYLGQTTLNGNAKEIECHYFIFIVCEVTHDNEGEKKGENM